MIVLASNSPRRKELLSREGVEFRIVPSAAAEKKYDGELPEEYAMLLSRVKAESVFNLTGGTVIGADTIVCLNGEVLGKPKDEEDAAATLRKLSGKTHEVITGYTVIKDGNEITDYEKTAVTFNELSNALISDYVKSGLPLDKAGSYGVQDGYPLVKKIDGDKDNVIGLPVKKIIRIL